MKILRYMVMTTALALAVLSLFLSTPARAFHVSVNLVEVDPQSGQKTVVFSKVIEDNGPLDGTPRAGTISLTQREIIPGYTVTGAYYTSRKYDPHDITGILTDVINKTGKTIEAYIFIGDRDFTGPANTVSIMGGGSWLDDSKVNDSIEMRWYVDPTNTMLPLTFASYAEIHAYLDAKEIYRIGYPSQSTIVEFDSPGHLFPFGYGAETFPLTTSGSFCQVLFFELILSNGGTLHGRSQEMVTSFDNNNSCTGSIGDYVWYDANLNGIQDAGELPAEGVTVYLLDAAGTTILDTTVTDQHGIYRFSNVVCGTYQVKVGVPSGYQLTTTTAAGSTTLNDSNPNPTTITLASGSLNLSVDFGLVHAQEMCGNCPNRTGLLLWGIEPASTAFKSGRVFVRYNQSYDSNDNSYGVNSVWGGTTHTFNQLDGSDKAQFIFRNAAGATVLDFLLDYIDTKSGTPSGWASLGPDGGDGVWISGNRNYLLSWNTSLARNLNDTGYCTAGICSCGTVVNLRVDSPQTVSNTSYELVDPTACGKWNFVNSYEMVVDGAAFGGVNNFSSVSVGTIHDSPAKKCFDNAVVPTPCPPLALVCASNTGYLGRLYSSSFAASGGTQPYTFSISSGSLPPGLGPVNASTGAITGTPTALGTYPYEATVVDSDVPPGSVTNSCSITISTAPVCKVSTYAFKFDKNKIKITIKNGGTSTATLGTIQFNKWPTSNGKFRKVTSPAGTVWDGADISASGPATLTGLTNNIIPAGGKVEYTFEFEKNANAITENYSLELQFADGCSLFPLGQ